MKTCTATSNEAEDEGAEGGRKGRGEDRGKGGINRVSGNENYDRQVVEVSARKEHCVCDEGGKEPACW